MEITTRIEEKDYPLELIKKLTPYLNHLTYVMGVTKKKITPQMRGFCWYYVYNHGNKSDAYRRANYSVYSKKQDKLLPRKHIQHNTVAHGGNRSYRAEYIKEGIRLIRAEIESKIKTDIPQTIIEQLLIQATYDPAMFIKVDGSPVFKTWKEIPEDYRCCIEGIDSKRNKGETVIFTKVKLVDRAVARKELLKIAPELLQPDRLNVIHSTIDSDGKPVGINYRGMSDAELQEILKRNGG